MSTYDERKIHPDKVAELAADIYELVNNREGLIAEGIMATYLALTLLTRNCACPGCECGDKASEEVAKELSGTGVDATIGLLDLELTARGL